MNGTDGKELSAKTLAAFFEGLAPEALERLAAISRLKSYRAGEMIFERGAPGLGFHVVAEGRVKIYQTAPDGREQILHLVGPGEPFGEAAVFMGQGYPADALALTEAVTVFIPRRELLALITGQPELALGLIGLMARRLARFAALLEAVTLKEVPARLAAFILELAGSGDRAELTLSKTQLASLLGTTPETISRSLGRLKSAGLVAEEKPYLIIKDRPRLELTAEGLEPKA